MYYCGCLLLICLQVITAAHVENMEILDAGPKFSWKMCNKTAVPMTVKELQISPDPLQFGQFMKLTVALQVDQDIGTTKTLKTDLKVLLNMQGQYYDLCNYSPHYCHMTDVCDRLSNLSKNCPPLLVDQGITCKCPLKKGSYSVKQVAIPIPSPRISVSGQFDITLELSEKNQPITCVEVQMCIGEC